jgi:hypothetical protein
LLTRYQSARSAADALVVVPCVLVDMSRSDRLPDRLMSTSDGDDE